MKFPHVHQDTSPLFPRIYIISQKRVVYYKSLQQLPQHSPKSKSVQGREKIFCWPNLPLSYLSLASAVNWISNWLGERHHCNAMRATIEECFSPVLPISQDLSYLISITRIRVGWYCCLIVSLFLDQIRQDPLLQGPSHWFRLIWPKSHPSPLHLHPFRQDHAGLHQLWPSL